METSTPRRAPRVAYRAPVELVDLESREQFSGASINLSEGGVRVAANALLIPGKRVHLALPLGGQSWRLFGRVVWNRVRAGIGIEFVDLSHYDAARLRAVVQSTGAPASVEPPPPVSSWMPVPGGAPPLEWPLPTATARVLRVSSLRPRRLLSVGLAALIGLGIGGLAAYVTEGGEPAPLQPNLKPTAATAPDPERKKPSAPASSSPPPSVSTDPESTSASDSVSDSASDSDSDSVSDSASASPPPHWALTAEPGAVILRLPFDGSPEGASHYELASPRGIAITIPRARSAFQTGIHPIRRHGLRLVRLADLPGGGLRFRLLVSGAIPPYQITFEPDAVVMTFTR